MKTNPVRFILSIALGVFVAYFVTMFVQYLIPLMTDITALKPEAQRDDFIEYMGALSLSGNIGFVLSYIAGAFSGGYAAARSAKERKHESGLAVGLFLTIIGVFFVILFTHPLWMATVICCSFIPFALLGAKVAGN